MVTLRTDATYLILGLVVDKRTRQGIAGVQVEVRERDTRYHDILGQTVTDERGAFTIGFEPEDFGDYAPDAAPDVFFRLAIDGALVLDTQAQTMVNLQRGRTSVTLELERGTLEPAKPDRVSLPQMVKMLDWWQASDFKGVAREAGGKLGTLSSLLGERTARKLQAWDFAPVRPPATAENTVVGQAPQAAQSALAQQQVAVAEVRTVDASTRSVLRSLGDVPLALQAGDRVVLYQEDGKVRYYTRVPAEAAASIDQQTVAGLQADVGQLKAQALEVDTLRGAVTELRSTDAAQQQVLDADAQALRERSAELEAVKLELQQLRQSHAEKDVQIGKLTSDLVTLRKAQDNLAARLPLARLDALEQQLAGLGRVAGPVRAAPATPTAGTVATPKRRRAPAKKTT